MPAFPRVLITASLDGQVMEYRDAIREAGAEPVRVDASADPSTVLDGIDGVLLTGGGDVAPARYGASSSPLALGVEPERDALEIAILRAAREKQLPTLCICRGLQVANVAFGGTLLVDIPQALGDAAVIAHELAGKDGRNERGLIAGHVARIDPGSMLARIVGTTDLVTGARHHQAVGRCADDVRIVARTDDGIVEGLEARFSSPFWLAVQWHPESTRELDEGASRALFSAFVHAAQARAAEGVSRRRL